VALTHLVDNSVLTRLGQRPIRAGSSSGRRAASSRAPGSATSRSATRPAAQPSGIAWSSRSGCSSWSRRLATNSAERGRCSDCSPPSISAAAKCPTCNSPACSSMRHASCRGREAGIAHVGERLAPREDRVRPLGSPARPRGPTSVRRSRTRSSSYSGISRRDAANSMARGTPSRRRQSSSTWPERRRHGPPGMPCGPQTAR
jgi:hypothetical protein